MENEQLVSGYTNASIMASQWLIDVFLMVSWMLISVLLMVSSLVINV